MACQSPVNDSRILPNASVMNPKPRIGSARRWAATDSETNSGPCYLHGLRPSRAARAAHPRRRLAEKKKRMSGRCCCCRYGAERTSYGTAPAGGGAHVQPVASWRRGSCRRASVAPSRRKAGGVGGGAAIAAFAERGLGSFWERYERGGLHYFV